ncbi:sister chromatid cohesion protein PDS5 homolog A-like [Phragmites australis]|uniref:sister chromatid cohesion protein PDS5 homolog A-like n=1 Tax=Phragmites australis TaxID=29695 RepID=UPI002D7843F5|nr:sister chromatid cohesion protein PDS5 homolog A-like [Phragmites australis]
MAAAEQLRELGEKLQAAPPAPADELAKLLEKAVECFHGVEQSPGSSVMEAIQPSLKAVTREELMKHEDEDVKVLLATCFCEITRITAPDAPYNDDVLRDIFYLIVGTFSGLSDINSQSFGRRVAILETVARYRACVVMLDLECDDLITDMFRTFLEVVSESHEQNIVKSMQTIMTLIIDESEDIQESLLRVLLSALGWRKTGAAMSVRKLACNVIEHSAGKLEPYIKKFLVSSLAGDSSSSNDQIDHHRIIFDVYQCAPKVLKVVVPYVTGELLADQVDIRSKAVELLGEIFSLPGAPILESFKSLFAEFLKRLTDRVVEIRVSVIEHLKRCLMSNPSRPEAPEIIKALCDRLLDYEENVRKGVVAALCDVACHSPDVIPIDTIKVVAERVRDKSLTVKCFTMERLADIYKLYCQRGSDSSTNSDDFEWITGKILRCLYDKDFRPESIESILCDSLFPPEFPTKGRVKHWVTAVTHFDKVEMKALEQILLQKQRLQQEMLKYMSLRQLSQEDAPDLQKRILGCFRSMSRLFSDPAKCEENLNMLHQLKDDHVWKIFTSLLDCSTTFEKAWSLRADLLKILGENHSLYDFVGALAMRCSYLLVNKEYAKEILLEASEQKTSGNTKLISSCMNLLTAISSFFPSLLSGLEEDIVELLKEDNELLKEGIAHVLSKAGGNIREQLASSSSLDLLLERLCLEGTRRQAKYSVHALAAITKDDGLMSLSVLYKRLVDLLEEKKVHLPSILQSLGCIAQIAMPIFETREEEIISFITKKILECNDMVEDSSHKSEWGDSTQNCLLKIYGIKTLVKSYLPCKDAHAHPGIEKLIGILKNILTYGDISPNMISSAVDKAHLRLAAAKAVLRLSRQWDQKVPVDVFYLTMRISQDDFPEVRKLFLCKVHQYIKERALDAKYACAFLLGIDDYCAPQYEEFKHNLIEVAQICQQVKMRQPSVQADMNLLTLYPEYILSYLVHALAHDPSSPDIEEHENVKAFGPIYWRLHLILSTLLGEEGLQHSGPDMKKESFTTILSIFKSIKCAQDVVDIKKTKTLHALCDLGTLIAKRLCQDQLNLSETQTVPLPAQFYAPSQDNQNDSSVEIDEQMWLGCEKVLAHFETLMTANNDEVESPKHKMLIDETDEFGNEITLGKIVKLLKSQGEKKTGREQKTASGSINAGNDDDVLGLLREINLDNQENLGEMEKSKPKKCRVDIKESNGKPVDFSTPKRKRSISKNRPHSSKGSKNSDELLLHTPNTDGTINSLESKLKEEKGKKESTDTEMLVSPTSSKTPVSKGNKGAKKSYTDILNSGPMKSANTDSSKRTTELGRLNGSVKRQKPKLISDLAKCSTHDSSSADLVGHRIKVWWPLDKKFYEGVVQSYDSSKKKHTVLYDDGDVEVLNLAKEKWIMIESNDSSVKKQKKDHPGTNKGRKQERASSSKQTLPNQNKSKKRPLPPKRKGLPKNKRRKTAEGKKSVEESSGAGVNDSDSSSSLAHSDVDKEVNSDGHMEEEAAVSSPEKDKAKDSKDVEMKEEKPEGHNLNGKEESDNETLSLWKKRTTKAT